ncbi:hypothetical protein [Branchiibius sp. NY16-3462-2]|uniref:hypothetical protein n=1 Tax=Branchiibius sp. NY16-3462-2 TaxID=1807500 RepID=UPI0007943A3D|nr:hypothetical protein [Branchiibius sp. NY16-3462-2]KYH43881.1 hypothetical protein AZH51_15725 [Branchiibius sp. NY16-3462-2]
MELDAAARSLCLTTPVDRLALLDLALRSATVSRRITSGALRCSLAAPHSGWGVDDYATELRDRLALALSTAIVGSGGRPARLDVAAVAAGGSFAAWLDRLTTKIVHDWSVNLIRRPVRRTIPTDPALLPAPTRSLNAAPDDPDEVVPEAIIRGLDRSFSSLRGSARILRLAQALERGLQLAPMARPAFDSAQRRAAFLAWLEADGSKPAVQAVLRALLLGRDPAHAAAGLLDDSDRDNVGLVESMVSEHTRSQLDHLLSHQHNVCKTLMQAAATPTPLPRQSTIDAMVALLNRADHRAGPRLCRRLVTTWAHDRADLSVSQWRDPNAREKNQLQASLDRMAYQKAAQRVSEASGCMHGWTPEQFSRHLLSLFDQVESAELVAAEAG